MGDSLHPQLLVGIQAEKMNLNNFNSYFNQQNISSIEQELINNTKMMAALLKPNQPIFSSSFSCSSVDTPSVYQTLGEKKGELNTGITSNKRKQPDFISDKRKNRQERKKRLKREKEKRLHADPSLIVNVVNGHPVKPITEEQKDIIVAYLTKEISLIQSGTESPQFEGYYLDLGVMKVKCLDVQSKNWLEQKIKSCKLWNKAALRVMDSKKLGNRVRISILVPRPIDDPLKTVKRIKWQNTDVDTSDWCLLEHRYVSDGCLLFIIMSERSWKQIANRKKLYVNFTQVGFSLLQCKNPTLKQLT